MTTGAERVQKFKILVEEYSGRTATDVEVHYARIPDSVGATAVRCKLESHGDFSCLFYDDELERLGSMALEECEFTEWPPKFKLSFFR